MRTTPTALALLAAAALLIPAYGADTAEKKKKTEDAIKQINAKTARLKGFTADFAITTEMASKKRTATGSISFLLPDKVRMTTALPIGKGEQTTISDGKTTWVLIPAFGTIAKVDLAQVKKALKEAGLPEQPPQHNIAKPLSVMQPGTATLERTETLGDVECWVFEGKPTAVSARPGAIPNAARMQVHVSTQDGTARQIAFVDADGKAFIKLHYRNVQTNPLFKADTFDYRPPADAAVTDHTQQIISLMKMMLGPGGNR